MAWKRCCWREHLQFIFPLKFELASKEEFFQGPWFLDQPQPNSNPSFLLVGVVGDFLIVNLCHLYYKICGYCSFCLWKAECSTMMSNSCIFGLSKSLSELWWHRHLVFGTDPDRNRVLEKPPAVNRFPAVESHLGVRASYATRRKRRYEANKCGWGSRSWDKLAVET
jgi:hypothetical protein